MTVFRNDATGSGLLTTDRDKFRWNAPPGWPIEDGGFVPSAEWCPDWNWPAPRGNLWWTHLDSNHSTIEVPHIEDESVEKFLPEDQPTVWMAPPNWPALPNRWTPPLGWTPDPAWDPAPLGWEFWKADGQALAKKQRHALRDQVRRVLLNVVGGVGILFRLNKIEVEALKTKYELHHDSIPYRAQLTAGVYMPGDAPEVLRYDQVSRRYIEALCRQRDELLRCLATDNTPGLDYANFALLADRLKHISLQARINYHIRHRKLVASADARGDLREPYEREFFQRQEDMKHYLLSENASAVFDDEPADDDWATAERFAATALRGFGYRDAEITASGTDAGIDVAGEDLVAQVKYRNQPTGRPELQRLVGANSRHRTAVFFSRKGYTKQAVDYGNEMAMALFEIELPRTVRAVNESAARMQQGTNT